MEPNSYRATNFDENLTDNEIFECGFAQKHTKK